MSNPCKEYQQPYIANNPCPPPKPEDEIKVKRCIFPPPSPLKELTPCQKQIREDKLKKGVVFCPKEPIVVQPQAPCLAICIEKVKNHPIPADTRQWKRCPVAREETGFARCDMIRAKTIPKPDRKFGCPPSPPPSPPKVLTPCEKQKKHEAYLQCKERFKKYQP